MTPTPRCGFIGLGAMGGPMARHLATAGLLVAVCNRSPGKADTLAAELGVEACADAGAMATRCDVVLLCVSADTDVLQNVGLLARSLAPGSLVIDHSTVSADTAREAARLLATGDIDFIDAPVSGGVEGAVNGRLSVMMGGSEAAAERARAVLECYAAKQMLMGEVGAGQATKAVNQVLVAGIAEAVCEGLALGEALGLDPARLLPTLGAGAAGSWFLEKRGATMLRNEFKVGFKLALLHKDLKIVEAMAGDAGIRAEGVARALQDYAELIRQGHGDDDISALIRLKRSN